MVLLVDGNNVASRAFFGYKAGADVHGNDLRAAYGTVDTLRVAIENLIIHELIPENTTPLNIVVVWDGSVPDYRRQYTPQYKSKPSSPDHEERREAVYTAKELLERFIFQYLGVISTTFSQAEGDDLIGVLTQMIKENCVIISTDTDYYQLLSESVSQWNPKEQKLIKHSDLKLSVTQTFEVKLLAGDPSDNLPGVKGVGHKKAEHLIKTYGSIQELYRMFYTGEYLDHREKNDIKKVGESYEYISSAFVTINLRYSTQMIPGIWEHIYYSLVNFNYQRPNLQALHQWFYQERWIQALTTGTQNWLRPFNHIKGGKIELIG